MGWEREGEGSAAFPWRNKDHIQVWEGVWREKSMCWVPVSRGLWSWALRVGSDTSTEFLSLLLQQTSPDTETALQFVVLFF